MVQFPAQLEFFPSDQNPDRLWCPLSLLFIGNWGHFPLGKVAGHEVDHSPLSSAEVYLMAWCLLN
jgi:hypothetical protein